MTFFFGDHESKESRINSAQSSNFIRKRYGVYFFGRKFNCISMSYEPH